MKRIRCLGWYQKGILLLMAVMVLAFAVIYAVTIAREGFAYEDAILVPKQENGNTVYSGKIQGEQASFTVYADKTVEFRYGDKLYGPYAAREDPSAIPDADEEGQPLGGESVTGVELRCGEEIMFRGCVVDYGNGSWLYNEDGSLAEIGFLATSWNGIVTDENGNVIETKDPVLLRKTISAETSEKIKEYLGAVMDYGTGKSAQVEGYDIGAKTGTAEELPRGNGKYLLSYLGCAPQNNPEVVIYVVVDEPNTEAQDDSSLVRRLAKSIMEEAFPYLGITTIEAEEKAAAEAAAAESSITGDEEYTDYNEDYDDTYDKPDGE